MYSVQCVDDLTLYMCLYLFSAECQPEIYTCESEVCMEGKVYECIALLTVLKSALTKNGASRYIPLIYSTVPPFPLLHIMHESMVENQT